MKLLSTVACSIILFLLNGCADFSARPVDSSIGHIKSESITAEEIPEPVQKNLLLPKPPPVKQEKYTVVVNEVSVKELLFALARDSKINIDIDTNIDGLVTINAVEQTLSQLLERITRQVDIRYEFIDGGLVISRDLPYFRTYKIDYVNISRDTDSSISIATQIATTGSGIENNSVSSGGNNNSTTKVYSISRNQFWKTLTLNVLAILGTPYASDAGKEIIITDTVIPNPESGHLTVKADFHQHQKIQELISRILESANRQVLVQATIVQVELSDQYRAGVDWSFINNLAGVSLASATLGATPFTFGSTFSQFLLTYDDAQIAGEDALNITVSLLDKFGNAKVLSSPQLMVLNNQTAILKVVDNIVYFTIEQETNTTQGVVTQAFETTVHTVPVGIVMSVTPQINYNNSVMLNVRPTVSRVNKFVNDPNPALAAANVENPIPEIQVREMESLLKMNNNQIAVLGGLMREENRDTRDNIPFLSRLPGIGKMFETRSGEYVKTELVIFLRPVIINNPGIYGDFKSYKSFLDDQFSVEAAQDNNP